MKNFILILACIISFPTFSQNKWGVFGESQYIFKYEEYKQVIGVSRSFNNHEHSIILGYDGLLAGFNKNFGLGYQYVYQMDFGLALEGNIYVRYGEIVTSIANTPNPRPCIGKVLLEESFGVSYRFKLGKRFSLSPLIRWSFIQGFNDEFELPANGGTIHCVNKVNTSFFIAGLRYNYNF